jgi:AcrR family transcriptional regulator
MGARAVATEATKQRMLEAVVELLRKQFQSEIRLEDVAAGAEVTVQTILNVFGNRSTLLEAGFATFLQRLRAQRLRVEPGNLEGAVKALVDHYEKFGDLVVRNLIEQADPAFLATGRAGHRQWVQKQFAAQIGRAGPGLRRSLTDALVCACDVYTWKLLRRDLGRSRAETEKAILLMAKSVGKEL